MLRAWKLWLIVVVLLAVAIGFAAWRQRRPLVAVAVDPPLAALGHAKRSVTLKLHAPAAGLRRVEARVVQDGNARTVLTEEFPAGAAGQADRPLQLDAASLGLKEGQAELVVYAEDSLWRPRPDRGPRLTHRFTVDLTPPTVELRAATGYIKHAGAGVVVYKATGASRSGVQVGAAFFPGIGGLAQDPALLVALYTVPYGGPQTPPSILAEDEAGNQRITTVPVTFLPARFPKDTIKLTDAFLQRKVPELAPQTPGNASPEQLLQGFLKVNGEGR